MFSMTKYRYSFFCRSANVDGIKFNAHHIGLWSLSTVSSLYRQRPTTLNIDHIYYADTMNQVRIALLTLIASTCVFGYCHKVKIHGIGRCSYRFECVETIKYIKLDDECKGAANIDIEIDVTLRNATDSFHLKADNDLLSKITTLRIFGNWPYTDLPFLDSMQRLKNVYLSYCNMQRINESPFRTLINIEEIDVSHNSLSKIEELFQFDIRPYKMRKLSLAQNVIDEVPGYTFEALTSLTELDLSYNFIRELNEEPFCNLTNLEILRLNDNKIISLNGAVYNLTNLKHLYLKNNHIKNIDIESLKTIAHLETFDISYNEIDKIKPVILSRHWDHFRNYTICRIIISGNHIYIIPDGADFDNRHKKKSLTNNVQLITQLDLSRNSISHIEYKAFNSIFRLDSLDLSNNKLLDFLVNSEDLKYVKYLNLSCNSLNSLNFSTFSLMHNLQNLDLSHNSMIFFPDQSLSNIYKLKNVNVTYNYIDNVYNMKITFHSEGGVLDLSNNGLSVLNIPENEALGLSNLILNSNKITDAYLIRLTGQRDLTRLDMGKNLIKKLDESSLQLPNNLVSLDLSYNEIQKIGPSAFHRVYNLKTLRLSHNRIQTIEYGVFRGLSELFNLDLSYNNIHILDLKVFMDLKLLSVLSLRHNGLNFIERDSWLANKQELKIYLDDNELSCDWLAEALQDFNNGYSKMIPCILVPTVAGHSIEGIPCKQEVGFYDNPREKYITDERLLITSQKILEAIKNQTSYLKKYIWHSIIHSAEHKLGADKGRIE